MSTSDLIERLRAAEGPDRELDAEIAKAIGWRPHMPVRLRGNPNFRYEQCSVNPGTYVLMHGAQPCGKEKYVRKFTCSVDIALSLAEEILPEWLFSLHQWEHEGERYWWVEAYPDIDAKAMMEHRAREKHASAAIALLLCLLQAKEASDE